MNPNKKLTILTFEIFAILVGIFSVIPGYVEVIGVNGKLLLAFLIDVYGLLFIIGGNKHIFKYDWMFWLFLAVYNVQVLYDTGAYEAFTYFLQYTMICIVITKCVNSEKRFLTVIDVLIKFSFIIGFFGIFEAVSKINVFHVLAPQIEFYTEIRLGILRIMTTFYHPISYCNYLIFIGSLILYRMQMIQIKGKQTFLRFVYMVVVINSILTLSRSTMLIFIVTQIFIAYKMGFLKMSVNKFWYVIITILPLLFLEASGSKVLGAINNIFLMFLSLFDSSYVSKITVDFGENSSGIGNRLDLYSWVYSTVRDHIIFGMGTNTTFSYAISQYQTKSSIEVEYLRILFNHGIVGLTTLIASFVGTLVFLIRRVNKLEIHAEKVGFNVVAFVTLLGYYISFFAVNQSEDAKIYLIFIGLVIAYNHKRFKTI